MTIAPGARLGSYEILTVLGSGGMGAVYRARDTRLGREVAVKVILEAFAADPDRVARFQREAKVLASLNHPHVAALYGLEEAAGQHFLVMELVEGQTLADRLARGALPVEETLAIAVQIAEALEAAHEKGVVHRDLKPANVKVTPDDRVKVLDFGLAKAIETETSSANAANSPTLSMMASQAGIILGTAAYMSPEQAKGLPADHRSDIFSFGSVLFEMLTGRQPFQGETAPDVLASVLVRDPEIRQLPADLHPRLSELVRRCLEKHPKRRWQAIGDVRAELEAIAAAPRSGAPAALPAPDRTPWWTRALVYATVAVAAGALGAAAAWALKPASIGRPVRFAVALPEGQRFTATARRFVCISPDGANIAYVANNRIFIRSLDSTQSIALQGTESAGGALAPVFSPDARWVLFYSPDELALKRIPITGGASFLVASVPNVAGVAWTDSSILYAQVGPQKGIYRVSENGGSPQLLVPFETDELGEAPQLLPDGDGILFTSARGTAVGPERWESAAIVVYSIKTGKRTRLIDGASDGRYLRPGYLLFARGATVFAQRFDADARVVSGAAVPVLQGVRRGAGGMTGIADYSVSSDGTVVYVAGPATGITGGWEIVLSGEAGTMTALDLPTGPYQTPRASPDGKRIAVGSDDNRDAFVGVYDLSGASALRRVTYGGKERYPVWSPDGRRLTYQSGREGDLGIFWQAADGSGAVERLTRPNPGEAHIPQMWAKQRTGDVLLYDVVGRNEVSLWMLSLADRRPQPFGDVRSNTLISAMFSPNGRWVAYDTREDARSRVFVQPFPATGAKYVLPAPPRTSPHHPLWSADGTRLYYGPALGVTEVVTVTTTATATVEFGHAQPMTRSFQEGAPSVPRVYDMMPDGRFLSLGLTRGQTTEQQEMQVVLNWFEDLKTRLPPAR